MRRFVAGNGISQAAAGVGAGPAGAQQQGQWQYTAPNGQVRVGASAPGETRSGTIVPPLPAGRGAGAECMACHAEEGTAQGEERTQIRLWPPAQE
jgi:hypothetical protein